MGAFAAGFWPGAAGTPARTVETGLPGVSYTYAPDETRGTLRWTDPASGEAASSTLNGFRTPEGRTVGYYGADGAPAFDRDALRELTRGAGASNGAAGAASGGGPSGVRVDVGDPGGASPGAMFGAVPGDTRVDLGGGTGLGGATGGSGSGGTAASGAVASPGTGSAPGAQASPMTSTAPVWDGTVSTPAATPLPALPDTTALSDADGRVLDRPETLPADADAGTPRANVTTPTPALPNAVVTTPTPATPTIFANQATPGGPFTSTDPLVGDLANKIEAMFPGRVKAVNVPLYKADGSKLTDIDIQLTDANIQVKSGSGSGLTKQMVDTSTATGQRTIAYGTKKLGTVLTKNPTEMGYEVYKNEADLLKALGGGQ